MIIYYHSCESSKMLIDCLPIINRLKCSCYLYITIKYYNSRNSKRINAIKKSGLNYSSNS